MLRTTRILLAVVFASVVASSISCSPPPLAPRPPPTRIEKAACPLGVMDASVTVEDTSNGVALVVVVAAVAGSRDSRDDADELRQRARDAAKLHGPFGRLGRGHHGRHQRGGHHGLHAFSLPTAHATAIDVEGGARIELVPEFPSDLDALRAGVRGRASKMIGTPCDI